jgi:proteasome lid subunit RPN8/RPN11
VTRVYVDVRAAAIQVGGDRTVDPAAVRAISFLVEAKVDVVLVHAPDEEPPPELREAAGSAVTDVPSHPDTPAWLLTTDVEQCTGTSARLRTILVGTAPARGAIHRCDSVARDVHAAILEILASEAMPPS